MKKIDSQPAYAFQEVQGHPVIEGVWSLELPPGEDRIAPDASCELIFHLGASPEEQTPAGWKRQRRHLLYGPLTRVLRLRFDEPMKLRAVRLRPAGIGHLTPDPMALRDASHDLAGILEEDTVKALKFAAEQGLTELARAARSRLRARSSGQSERIESALAMFAAKKNLNARTLADEMKVSARTLERNFRRFTGLRPSEFMRIHRFHSARRAVKADSASLAGIAVAHGYSDQAHMTREFQRLAGLTPRRKRSGEGNDLFYDN